MSDTDLMVDPTTRSRAGDTSRFAIAEGELDSIVSPPLAADQPQASEPAIWSRIALEVHGDLSEIEQEWTTFERRADCTAFQSFAWLAAWQRHIGARNATVPAIIFGRDPDRRLVCILQLAIETSGWARAPVRRLTWLGSALCDYNSPLLADDFSRRLGPDGFVVLWRNAIELLQADPRFRFDLIDLQKMPETIASQKNPLLDLPVLAHPSGAYVASLTGDWEKFYAAKRSSSTRKRERRQLKQLAEHGEVKFVDVRSSEDIRRTMGVLIEQKTRSFARMGVENLFARPGHRDFFLDVAESPNIHVSRLDVGSTIAAANLGLKFRDCYYLVLSSYLDGELSRLGPGRAHLHELLRHAIDCGFRRFDFTIGDEPYKHDWSDTEVRVYDHLAAATVRGWMALATTFAYRRTKRLIKQTPALWRAFSKMRTLATAAAARGHSNEAGPATDHIEAGGRRSGPQDDVARRCGR